MHEYLSIFFYIFFLFLVIYFFRSFFSLAPWVPTNKKDLGRINSFLQLTPGEKFLEVGCGTAHVSIYIAKNNPDCEVTGIEMSPLLYWIATFQAKKSGCKNLKIIRGNALKLDFSQYEVLYIFGLPETIQKKIFPKLKKELQKGARFFSYCISMEQNTFTEIKHKESSNVYAVYEYERKD